MDEDDLQKEWECEKWKDTFSASREASVKTDMTFFFTNITSSDETYETNQW